MAIPPDPIEALLPAVDGAVLADVTRVVEQDPQAPLPTGAPGATSLPGDLARQVVELKVKEVLFGRLAARGDLLAVIKPAGDYTLVAGATGPFLLQVAETAGEPPVILGRYGPDSYRTADVRAAARKLGKR
jgi:hypothetical protein